MILWKKQTRYESEITKFIAEMKEKNPKLEEGQREGRALLWDKEPIDLDQRARAEESKVKQTAYVYQSH
jgi:hypothetical protein